MKNVELLAPCGNPTKLKTAFLYGADAVYCGGKDFSLRAYCDNFAMDELKEAVRYAHSLGKKIYVTANIFAKNSDLKKAEDYFSFLAEIKADAALITDIGLIRAAKSVAPSLAVHISTQANTLNKYAVSQYGEMGASRVVLARELSIDEIAEIHAYNPSVELEVFVHGAMCVSYSGRCLLSNYFTSRDGNRGECVQACRWGYKISGIDDRPHPPAEIYEDDRGTYILNSKDLNLIRRLEELRAAGAVSFKIEGRMKSEYYLATVVNAYRRAMDNSISEHDALLELKKIAHREYTEGFIADSDKGNINLNDEQNRGTHEFIASVLSYKDGIAEIEMRNRFKKDDVLEVLSPKSAFNKSFCADTIINKNGEHITDAKLVQEILYLPVPFELSAGDILRRKRD